ncbi:hypothetical protein [Pseudoxanthomonas sp. PXM05]|uniref:hypothetical protein n=1 Tax=Pseudoxanthomonas sp. PXM05 TaxID=2854775 RepID=UPI001C467245|nr:hypothetical protein [Pseudoxanthomonas sp. PXM05]MBV7474083.1 hypothetical protein [Pseudoxanthomonas sp. PXM05]
MGLRFPGTWRFTPPPDGAFINSSIPDTAVWEFAEVIEKVISQGTDRWLLLEHFKGSFGTSSRSSSESWAESDLHSAMRHAAENAPLFVEQLVNGFEQLQTRQPQWFIPNADFINRVLAKNNIGYEIRPPDLVAREAGSKPVPVSVPEPSMEQRARDKIEKSLKRSEELLTEGRPREAVQESLWLLETVATAFRGLETGSGKIEGKYFNNIVRDIRSKHSGSTLEQVLGWITTMHGYLSSPTGGGVRHGTDLDRGVDLDQNQALLFCNLIRSYVQFLLREHGTLTAARDA